MSPSPPERQLLSSNPEKRGRCVRTFLTYEIRCRYVCPLVRYSRFACILLKSIPLKPARSTIIAPQANLGRQVEISVADGTQPHGAALAPDVALDMALCNLVVDRAVGS